MKSRNPSWPVGTFAIILLAIVAAGSFLLGDWQLGTILCLATSLSLMGLAFKRKSQKAAALFNVGFWLGIGSIFFLLYKLFS